MKKMLEEFGDAEFLSMDGYDDCAVGVVERFGEQPIICYDRDKVIAKNIESGMTEEEAVEYFEYNQIGGFHGPLTPCFISQNND